MNLVPIDHRYLQKLSLLVLQEYQGQEDYLGLHFQQDCKPLLFRLYQPGVAGPAAVAGGAAVAVGGVVSAVILI